VKIKLVDTTHVRLRDPETDRPLKAIGRRADGSMLWPILGSDGEGDEGGSDEDAREGEADEEGESEEETDEGGTSKEKESSKKRPISAAEFDELKRKFQQQKTHLANADRRKSAAERELEQLKRKDQTDLQNAQDDLKKVTEERDEFKERFLGLARTNAFLTASAQESITWHDPKDAQAVASKELRELEITEEGEVTGIRDLIKSLAKRKPHLVKKESEGEEDKSGTNGRRGASGSGVGSTKTSKGKKDGKPSREEIRLRFPSLR
jgi:hypothetical protein